MKSTDWSLKSKNRYSEAVARRCSVKKVFLKISQNSQQKHLCKSFFNKFTGSPPAAASGNYKNQILK